jgi:hypothetical protein
MEDNVETFAATAPIGFGLVVGRTAPHQLTVQAGGADPVGISLSDALIASRGGYTQYDAVSVMTRGRVWCQAADPTAAMEDGIYAFYDPATGKVAMAGTQIPNAVFRGKAVAVYDITYTTTTNIVEVELHYPLAVGP